MRLVLVLVLRRGGMVARRRDRRRMMVVRVWEVRRVRWRGLPVAVRARSMDERGAGTVAPARRCRLRLGTR